MQIHKPRYFNAYKFSHKLLPLLICCFLIACRGQSDTKQSLSTENQSPNTAPVININTASAAELEKLPHIGAKTAQAIVEYREKFGGFRKPEHLLLIQGISDEKFREVKSLIKVE